MLIQHSAPAKFRACLGLALLLWLCLPAAAQSPELQPTGHINDFAGVLSGQAKSQLEAVAAEVKQKTGAEIAVAIVKSLQGDTVENFANILAEHWGVGDQEDRGALLLLLAIEDRKLRIEIGYGVEPIIPDGRAGEIREHMRPHLQSGNYDMAVATGVVELGRIVAQDAGVTLTMLGRAQPAQGARRRRLRGFGIWPLLFFLPFPVHAAEAPRRLVRRGHDNCLGCSEVWAAAGDSAVAAAVSAVADLADSAAADLEAVAHRGLGRRHSPCLNAPAQSDERATTRWPC